MTITDAASGQAPGILSSAWRYRWLTVPIVVLFGVAGYALPGLRPAAYEATAAVVLQDPARGLLLGSQANSSSDRLVSNALEVFQFRVVSDRATELAAEHGVQVSVGDLDEATTVSNIRGTDVVSIRVLAEDPDRALVIAGAVVDAYQEVRRSQFRAQTSAVAARLDTAEAALNDQLDELTGEIEALRAESLVRQQINAVIVQIVALGAQVAEVGTASARDALLDRMTAKQVELEVLQLAALEETTTPEITALNLSRDEVLDQLAEIASRRTELEIDAENQASDVAFFSPPAITRDRQGASRPFTIAGAGFLGFLVSLGASFVITTRRRVFQDLLEPEAVLGVPALADIPRFDTRSTLPVREEPRTPAAEAFRFAASNLAIRMESLSTRSVMIVSATTGDGKSTICANTALAAARSGSKVLVIDADFGNQKVSTTLLGEVSLGPGLTEVVSGTSSLSEAVHSIEGGRGGSLSLIGRGRGLLLGEGIPGVDGQARLIVRPGDLRRPSFYAGGVRRFIGPAGWCSYRSGSAWLAGAED